MSKVTNIILFVVILDVLLGLNHYGSATGILYNAIIGIQGGNDILNSTLYLMIAGFIGIATVVSTGIVPVFRSDLAIKAGAAIAMLAFTGEILIISNTLNNIWSGLGWIFGLPITIMFMFYSYEWWNTPLS